MRVKIRNNKQRQRHGNQGMTRRLPIITIARKLANIFTHKNGPRVRIHHLEQTLKINQRHRLHEHYQRSLDVVSNHVADQGVDKKQEVDEIRGKEGNVDEVVLLEKDGDREGQVEDVFAVELVEEDRDDQHEAADQELDLVPRLFDVGFHVLIEVHCFTFLRL